MAGDGLAWLLYREGIREIRFLKGFEQAELEVLLDILGRARVATINEDDLVTMLWLANLTFFSYRHVEVVLSPTGQPTSPDATDEEDADESAVTFGVRGGSGGMRTMPAAVDEEVAGFLDRSPSIVIQPEDDQRPVLDPADLAYLQRELARDYGAGFRQTMLEALLEIVEMEVDEASRLEAIAALDELLLEALGAGDYAMAAAVLSEAEQLMGGMDLEATALEALGRLAGRLSTPGVLKPLLQRVADANKAPPGEVLDQLLAEVRPEALPLLAGWLGAVGVSPVRGPVERAALRVAEVQPGALADALGAADDMVLAGALALAAQRPSAALVPALCALARHCDPALRLPVLGILGGFDAPPVREVLLAACVDSVREIRIAAYRQVRGRRLQEAREVLQQVVAAGGYATQDFNERVVLFEALGTVADASTVALLDRLLNARGLMGPKEPSDVRACAARGLARAASAAAREALERADGGRDPLVQRAVRLALDGEGGA